MNRSLMFWLASLLLFSGGMTVWFASRRDTPDSRPLPVSEEPLQEFTLVERSGKQFHSQSLKGQIWVGSFFFASCPHRCEIQNRQIKELQDEYGSQGVRFVSITCDPERDTPVKLAQYADRLGADREQWLFLTGNLNYIQRVGRDLFQVPVEPDTHSEKLMVFDPMGKPVGYYHWQKPSDLQSLRAVLDDLLEAQTGG